MDTQLFRNDIESVMASQGKNYDDALIIVKNNIMENEIKKKDYYQNSNITNAMNTLELIPKYSFPYTEYDSEN